jgi:hypothetical protein
VREALRRRDADTQAGERPGSGAHDDADQARCPDVLLTEEAPDRRQQGLAVPVAGHPRRDAVRNPVRGARGDDDLRRGRIDGEDGSAPPVVGHDAASR